MANNSDFSLHEKQTLKQVALQDKLALLELTDAMLEPVYAQQQRQAAAEYRHQVAQTRLNQQKLYDQFTINQDAYKSSLLSINYNRQATNSLIDANYQSNLLGQQLNQYLYSAARDFRKSITSYEGSITSINPGSKSVMAVAQDMLNHYTNTVVMKRNEASLQNTQILFRGQQAADQNRFQAQITDLNSQQQQDALNYKNQIGAYTAQPESLL